jgi:NAD-dependent dihydropyrimidine dehydrogenase PreA subunit
MMERQTVWVDVALCTGCGTCVDVCPVGAMALIEGKARVDEETCTGCEACVRACSEGAIQPVVRGELVPVPERPAPAVRQPSALTETAGAVVVATGVGLLAKVAGTLARAVDRWLTQRIAPTSPSAEGTLPLGGGRGRGGRGRQARHRRQRGRRG